MKLEMQRLQLVALQQDRKKILERLQRRGLVEVFSCEDERLAHRNTSSQIAQFEKGRETVLQAMGVLNEVTKYKPPMLAALKGKREIEKHAFGRLAMAREEDLQLAYRILGDRKAENDAAAAAARKRMQAEALLPWEGLDIAPDRTGTERTRFFIGSMTGKPDQAALRAALPEGAEAEIVSVYPDQMNFAVIAHASCADETAKALREMGFLPLADAPGIPVRQARQLLLEEAGKLEEKRQEARVDILSLAEKRETLEFMADYLQLRRDKYEALAKVAMTEKTFVLEGWIPKKYAPKLCRELEDRYRIAISLEEPGEDDDVPVLLENGPFASPVEGITEMYALPGKKDVDPSAVMAFFYYLFFGMMLSDAGYGLLMVLVTTLVLHKARLEAPMRKTMRMFQYCGISTVVWGALFGSWFGDAPQVIAREFFGKELGSLALWYEPLQDPMKLLLVSFALGICHLFLGLAVRFVQLWKQGKRWDAVFDVIPVYMMVLGVVPSAVGILDTGVAAAIPEAVRTAALYMALAGVALLVLTAGRSSKKLLMKLLGGFYGLYNTATGYLSDILSYSRLLALGLATGSIAGVVNMIGVMPENPVLKAVLFVVVFLVGHVANLAINLLGAYVHTDRLQFVELFSKFYEGGGRAFAPLKVNTKYVKFKEEESNE